jgi:hypothetical protein
VIYAGGISLQRGNKAATRLQPGLLVTPNPTVEVLLQANLDKPVFRLYSDLLRVADGLRTPIRPYAEIRVRD